LERGIFHEGNYLQYLRLPCTVLTVFPPFSDSPERSRKERADCRHSRFLLQREALFALSASNAPITERRDENKKEEREREFAAPERSRAIDSDV